MSVVVLAGGTGGAKLARGVLEVVGRETLSVIANTGDDVEVHGVHVSPDPDLITYWLAGEIDERGWGLRGDTWKVMEALEAAGRPAWFRLGDRDLAMCLIRTEALRAGETLTEAHRHVVHALDLDPSLVLPMADEPVRTRVHVRGTWVPFQDFMIRDRAEGPIEAVDFAGVERARPTEQVLAALAGAEAIVIGPSNPVISIGPILAVPGMREAIAASPAPVVAVSPFVAGATVKGPTEAFMRAASLPPATAGIVAAYGGLLDGVVTDEDVQGLPLLRTDLLMSGDDGRVRLARETLDFARTLVSA